MDNIDYDILIDDDMNIKFGNGFYNDFMTTALVDSTDRQEVENSIIRFFDKNSTITKMENAVTATVNNADIDLETAVLLFQKKILLKKYKNLNGIPAKYLKFKEIMETKLEEVPVDVNVFEYVSALHSTCPDSQYICLFFFNTPSIAEDTYGYKDCEDIFEDYARQSVTPYTLCYLKKELTAEKLAIIIHNANFLGLNTHISISAFYRPRRTIDYLYCTSSIIIDLDYYKTAYEDIDNDEDFCQELQPFFDKLGYEPTAIVNSGHGYYLYFRLDRNINLKSSSMRRLYQTTVQKMIQLFEPIGADPACSDLTRVFKIPSSINFKTGNQVYLCCFNPDTAINLSDLADSLGIHTVEQNNRTAFHKYYRGTKSRFTNANRQRMEDYEHLLALRNYTLPHMRDLFFLYVSVNCYNMGMPCDEVLAYCSSLNSSLHDPLPDMELKRTVLYLSNQLEEDGSCKVKYKNCHIADSLNISDREQESMHQLISVQTREKRKKAWDKANAHFRVLENKHKQNELLNEMLYCRFMENMSDREIAQEFSLDVRTVTRRIGKGAESNQRLLSGMTEQKKYYEEDSICFEVHSLKKQGLKYQAISELLHLSVRSVKRYAKLIKLYH